MVRKNHFGSSYHEVRLLFLSHIYSAIHILWTIFFFLRKIWIDILKFTSQYNSNKTLFTLFLFFFLFSSLSLIVANCFDVRFHDVVVFVRTWFINYTVCRSVDFHIFILILNQHDILGIWAEPTNVWNLVYTQIMKKKTKTFCMELDIFFYFHFLLHTIFTEIYAIFYINHWCISSIVDNEEDSPKIDNVL